MRSPLSHTRIPCPGLVRVLIVSLLLAPPPARALYLFLDGQAGVDSNPLELADSFDPDHEPYVSADAYMRHRFESGFYLKGRLLNRRYPGASDADWSWARFTPGYRSASGSRDEGTRYEVWLDYTTFDLTYIDNDTGEPGVFNGVSIADRFDSRYLDLNARLEHRTEADTRVELGVQARDKDYEDIEVSGLSDLDYRHAQIHLGAELRPGDSHRLSSRYILTEREYVDRRADDLNGDDIPGTDLEFEFDTLELGYRYEPDDDFRLTISYTVEIREDNASGFWDAETDDLEAEFRFAIAEDQALELRMRASEKTYDQSFDTSQIAAEEQDRDSDSRSIRLRLINERPGSGTDGLAYYVEAEAEDVDSDDPNDEYDRVVLGAGIRWEYH